MIGLLFLERKGWRLGVAFWMFLRYGWIGCLVGSEVEKVVDMSVVGKKEVCLFVFGISEEGFEEGLVFEHL